MQREQQSTPNPQISKSGTWMVVLLVIALVTTSLMSGPLNVFTWFRPIWIILDGRVIRSTEFHTLWNKEYAMSVLTGIDRTDHPSVMRGRVIRHEIMLMEAQKLGIDVSTDAAKNALQAYPAFMKNGAFSQKAFYKFLRQHDVSLKEMIEAQRAYMIRQLYVRALFGQITCPPLLLRLIRQGRGQLRCGYYKKFPAPLTAPVPPASEKELRELFIKNPIKAPEYRTFSFFFLDGKTKVATDEDENPMDSAMSRIEAQLSEGKKFEHVARDNGLIVHRVTVDSEGKDTTGALVNLNIPDALSLKVIKSAFSAEVGQDLLVEEEGVRHCVWVRLDVTAPSRALTFEEAVRSRALNNMYVAQKREEILEKQVQEFAARLIKNPQSMISSMNAIPFMSENNALEGREGNLSPEEQDFTAVVQALFALEPKTTTILWNRQKTALFMVYMDGVSYEEKPDAQLDATVRKILPEWVVQTYLEDVEASYDVKETPAFREAMQHMMHGSSHGSNERST